MVFFTYKSACMIQTSIHYPVGSSVPKGWLSVAEATPTSLQTLGSVIVQLKQHVGGAGCA